MLILTLCTPSPFQGQYQFVASHRSNILLYLPPSILFSRRSNSKYIYLTSNPSPRKHSLCNSISLLQSSSSSPFAKTHASRACLVSGQQQQIFLPLLIPTFCVAGGVAGADAEFPIFW
mmetsp:Transcript_19601/g.29212  ORF Transcript_19601/g.29212 Transcript_19601/m.29212 type:complete len:118 (-) Transcript_19601:153-506(-)